MSDDALAGCKGCGKCCSPVVLPWTQREIAERAPGTINPEDRRFVLEDLTPMRYKEGLAQAPYLQGLTTYPANEEVPRYTKPVFYSCKWFDPVERACTNYDNRPPVCRAYPLYGHDKVRPGAALPEGCVYGVPVTLTTKATR